MVKKFWKKSSWLTDVSSSSAPNLKTTLSKMWSQWINSWSRFEGVEIMKWSINGDAMRCYLHRMFHSITKLRDKSFIERPSFWTRHDCICKWPMELKWMAVRFYHFFSLLKQLNESKLSTTWKFSRFLSTWWRNKLRRPCDRPAINASLGH